MVRKKAGLEKALKKELSKEKKGFKALQSFKPAPTLSREQKMLQEVFGNERTFGTGKNLPEINNALTSGGGLIKNGDEGETGRMFGF